MNTEEIQNLCIKGTEEYLAYLEKNERGLVVISVLNKERISEQKNPIFKLLLGGRLFDPESIHLKLSPPGEVYGPDHFNVLEYDNDARVLIIQINKPQQVNLDLAHAENIEVISDLRFLVENVKRWFESNGKDVQLPRETSGFHQVDINEVVSKYDVPLSDCQHEALSTLLTNPMTYVWGPPGTGKTKHIVAAAVMLLQANKKIGIFAPTNNSLEQAMISTLHAAQTAGMPLGKFLRVGHASSKFAREFPEVCETQGIRRRIGELERQLKVYDKVINHRRGARVLNFLPVLKSEVKDLQDFLNKRYLINEEVAKVRMKLLAMLRPGLRQQIQKLEQERAHLETTINGRLEIIRNTQTDSDRLNAIIKKIDFSNIKHSELDISALEQEINKYLDTNAALAKEHEAKSTEEINLIKENLKLEIDDLAAQTIPERIKSAQVIGMTLDCLIGRFSDQTIDLNHIILDEAGYAPLVKALTLLRGNVPVTFIGDHKQLGPVCEMDDNSFNDTDKHHALIWKKSALFIGDVFAENSIQSLVGNWLNTDDPPLSRYTVAHLNTTYRFGPNLAKILSECVYEGMNFAAAPFNQELRITCLNAVPTSKSHTKRQNSAEAEVIASYLRDHPEIDTEADESFAILTPYTNQVSLLGKLMPQVRRQGKIMTIHKSQGQEWDTIFLSIVDGRLNSPWFTDTENSQSGGLHVMNTAVSRARKHLILVCNLDFWNDHPSQARQLISRLVS